MIKVNFSDEEKIKMFDEIAAKFFNKNFGQLTKSDIELLMARFYFEKLYNSNRNDDGTINYQKCSDFLVAKELGITPQKVRNLKTKYSLAYSENLDWKKYLAHLIENARFDKTSNKITVNIPDQMLFYELQEYIEQQGGYIDIQLNPKILQIRIEYFIDLVLTFEDGNNRKKIIKEIKNNLKKENKDEKLFDEKNIGKSLLSIGSNATGIVNNIASMFNPTNIIASAFTKLIKAF